MNQEKFNEMFEGHILDILDQMANGVVITEPEGHTPIIYTNKAFSDIFDYEPEDCIGKNCSFLQGSDTEQKNIELIREAIKEKRSIQTVLRNYTKHGKLVYNEVKISPIFDQERKELKFFIGVQRDISSKNFNDSLMHTDPLNTSSKDLDVLVQELNIFQSELLAQNEELVHRDKHLEALNSEFSSLFHDAPVSYIVIDKELQVKRYNKLADEYFNFTSIRSIKSLFLVAKDSNIEKLVAWIANKDYEKYNLEIDMICPTKGEINRFELHGKTYMINESLLLISLNNIQESYEIKTMLEKKVRDEVSKRMEQEKFILSQSKLASMGEMIDAVAHQWLNPLSTIKLYAQYTQMQLQSKKPESKESVGKYQKNIEDQVIHLVDTLTEFRSFFRPDESLEKLPVLDIVESCLILMKDELLKHNISVEIKNDEDLQIRAVKNQFKHVFINLLSNSRDAFEEKEIEKRNIRFEFCSDEENYIINYYDNAGGIPEKVRKRIFEPNFTTKSKSKGTGVGLYLCKQILDKFDIDIDVFNVDDGACFSIKYSKKIDTVAKKTNKLQEEIKGI